MLFKDSKFRNKKNVRKNMKECIFNEVKESIPFKYCNTGLVLQYIDLLLDESQFNIKNEEFYYQYRYVRVPLDCNIFIKVAVEYINEHLDYFLLEKNSHMI